MKYNIQCMGTENYEKIYKKLNHDIYTIINSYIYN